MIRNRFVFEAEQSDACFFTHTTYYYKNIVCVSLNFLTFCIQYCYSMYNLSYTIMCLLSYLQVVLDVHEMFYISTLLVL